MCPELHNSFLKMAFPLPNLYLEHRNSWTQDSFTTLYHFCPSLLLYAKWQVFKRGFRGTAAFDLATAISSCIIGPIPTSSPQSSTSGHLMAKVWTLQHGAYGKYIIMFVRKNEEKSLFGRNTRWPSHFEPFKHFKAQCRNYQAENSTIIHSVSWILK
jgi:hypothetical protein